jgi:hypothetical protein
VPSLRQKPQRAARNNQHGDDLDIDANHHRAYIEDMERHTPTQGETQMIRDAITWAAGCAFAIGLIMVAFNL